MERRGGRTEHVSRYSYQTPVHKTVRSSSLSTVSSYLSRPSSSATYHNNVGLERGSYQPSFNPSWSTKSGLGGGGGYNSEYVYQNGSYLNNDNSYTKKTESYLPSYSSYQSPTYQQPSYPSRSQSTSHYSSDTYQPSSFTTPPSQPLSILNHYINTQLYPSSYSNDGSALSYDGYSSISKPPVEHTNYKDSLTSKYSYKPPNYKSTSHYNDNLKDIYTRTTPILKRSQSYQAYRPASEVHVSHRESVSRPYYTGKLGGDVVSKYTSSYQPINLNYEYRQDFSSAGTQPSYQKPYENPYLKHYQHHKQNYQPFQRESTPDSFKAKVVAETNIVSSRTSAQRDLGRSSVSREANRRSFTPMHAMNTVEARRGVSSMTVPERSRSMAVTGDHPLNRSSFASRPRSTMLTNRPGSMMVQSGGPYEMSYNRTTSVGPSSRPPSFVASHRHSAVVPDHRRSRLYDSRSSIVGSSESMFKVEPAKRNSYFETKREDSNSREKDDSIEKLKRKTWAETDNLRNSFMERRRSKPGRGNNQDKENDSRYNPTSTKKVRSYTGSLYGVHIPDSFTPTLSETRKKARDLLCRVRKDPNYFSFK